MIKTLLFAVNMVHDLSLRPEKEEGLVLNCCFVCDSDSSAAHRASLDKILLQKGQKGKEGNNYCM